MGISLESMAIEMPAVEGHPNRVAFQGVLTFVDVASDRAPAGARGHRVILTRKAAEEAIPSLLGMGVDYSPRLDGHDTRRKIGVITRAEIVGREVAVSGFLYGRDFPEMVEEIGRGAGSRQASAISSQPPGVRYQAPGVRYQASGVRYQVSGIRKGSGDRGLLGAGSRQLRATQSHDSNTGLGMSYEIADAMVDDIQASVWVLNRVTFTGAAVLRRDKAAYRGTWIELVRG